MLVFCLLILLTIFNHWIGARFAAFIGLFAPRFDPENHRGYPGAW